MRHILKKGFTLIELLIVISIIGVLAGFIITNVAGARSRARDARKKSELASVKDALFLYQSEFSIFPGGDGLHLNGCGSSGNADCLGAGNTCNADFAAGPTCKVFMQSITRSGNYFFFYYYQCPGGDSYRAKTSLENKSDPDIAESQSRCPLSACPYPGLAYGATDYVTCP